MADAVPVVYLAAEEEVPFLLLNVGDRENAAPLGEGWDILGDMSQAKEKEETDRWGRTVEEEGNERDKKGGIARFSEEGPKEGKEGPIEGGGLFEKIGEDFCLP